MEDSIIGEILVYWFGPLDSEGLSAPEQHGLWFKSSAATDKACGELFRCAVEQAIAGKLDHWAKSDRGLIALILLLDQFPRNIYRGTTSAFSGDNKSLILAKQAIAMNQHKDVPLIHRVFLYLPLEHSEDLAVQEQCVALFEEMATATGLAQMTAH